MKLKPVVMDLEMSGLDPHKNGIWQIGAIDMNNKEKEFFDESRIDDDETVMEESLKVTGKTEEELRNPNKQSQKEMLEKFLSWMSVRPFRCFLCQNPQFDMAFLIDKVNKYGLKKTYNYRAFDLHSIAQLRYNQIHGKFLTRNNGGSGLDLTKILDFCGIPDKRVQVTSGEVKEEGTPHNALEDCKLTAECFSRLVYGEKMFEEFEKYEIPEGLKNKGEENEN